MNIKNPLPLLMVIVFALTMFSCNDDDNVEAFNPNETTALRLAFTIGNEDSFSSGRILKDNNRTLADLLEFSGGYIIVDELEFEGELNGVNINKSDDDDDDDDDDDEDDNDIEIEFDFENGARFDFGSDLYSSELLIDIPQGLYDEFSIEVDLYDEGNEPSLVLTGSFDDGAGFVPVIFQFKEDDFDFEIEEDNVQVDGSNSSIALVQLHPTRWFNNVSDDQLSNATRTEEGVIIISKTANANIYNTVKESMERLSDVRLR